MIEPNLLNLTAILAASDQCLGRPLHSFHAPCERYGVVCEPLFTENPSGARISGTSMRRKVSTGPQWYWQRGGVPINCRRWALDTIRSFKEELGGGCD